MSFTVQDYHDLVDLLEKHPQWRADLRRLLLSDDLLALPAIVDKLAVTVSELAEAQKRTEARVAELVEAQQHTEQRLEALTARVEALTARVEALTARLEELAKAQQHTEQRLEALTARVEALTARVEALTAWLEELAKAQQQTEQRLEELAEVTSQLAAEQKKMQNKLARVDGRTLEAEFRQKAAAYFGRLLRRLRVVEMQTLEDRLETQLVDEEFEDLLRLDLLLTGLLRHHPDRPQIWLAVEVSSVVDREDIVRARRRADLLRKAGYPTVPIAAGEEATLGAQTEARVQKVALIQDGSTQGNRAMWGVDSRLIARVAGIG